MAELDTSSGGGKKGGKVRTKKASTRVDLTAMVDLAFLLITFFMLTTTLSKPKAMDLTMPDKDEKTKDQLPMAESRSLTILLGANDKVEWYVGTAGKGKPVTDNYGKEGIRKTLIDKGKEIQQATGKFMFVLIKPSDKSSYKNVVEILDEMKITGVQSFAIVDILPVEVELLKRDGAY